MQLSICEMFTHIHWSNITIILILLQSYHIHSNNYVTNTPSNHDLNLKIPTGSENTKRISENTHRIYLKMAKCRLTRLAWSDIYIYRRRNSKQKYDWSDVYCEGILLGQLVAFSWYFLFSFTLKLYKKINIWKYINKLKYFYYFNYMYHYNY